MARAKSIISAADSGNRLETLKCLRHTLAVTIQKSESGRDIAALSRQLLIVMEEIAACGGQNDAAENVTVLEMVRKKHERIAAAED